MKTNFEILMEENTDEVKKIIANNFGIRKSDGKIVRCCSIFDCETDCLAFRKDGKCGNVVKEYLDKTVIKIPSSFIEKFNRLE